MNPTIFIGLLAAVLFGVANFIARKSSRRSGVISTLFWGQVFLAAVTLSALLVMGKMPQADPLQWLLLLASSAAIIGATGCLYRGLEIGRLIVVAPVMASYGAVSAVLSLISGERLTPWIMAGLIVTITGAILSAMPGQKTPENSGKSLAKKSAKSSGWLPATGAAVLFGVGYWLQGTYVIPAFGPMAAIAFYYLTATGLLGLAAILAKQSLHGFHSLKDLAMIILTAALGGGGFIALAFAQSFGDIAIATALSSAATAISVLLAFAFLREKPAWSGWVGLICVVAGAATLQSAS